MSTNLADILKKLGWSDGFQVPLANGENRALENELANLSLRKSKAKNALDVVNGRLDALKDHFKFVNQESDQTQVSILYCLLVSNDSRSQLTAFRNTRNIMFIHYLSHLNPEI